MQAKPELRVSRFAQLDSGDLFLWREEERASVGIVAVDPTENDQKLILSLGPDFPHNVIGPFFYTPTEQQSSHWGRNMSFACPCSQGDGSIRFPLQAFSAFLSPRQAHIFA